LDTPGVQERVAVDEKRIGSILFKRCKGHIDLTASTGVSNLNLQPQCAGGRFYVPQRRLGSHGADWVNEHGYTRSCGHQLTQKLNRLSCQLKI
jgi:hypothetical protein